MTTDGFVVVWEHTSGSVTDVYGQRYDSSGNANGSEFVSNTAAASADSPARVAMSGSDYRVVWEENSSEVGRTVPEPLMVRS